MNSNFNTFIAGDFSQYSGKWIAIENKKIISHGESFKQVFHEAKRVNPAARPFIAKVPSGETMIF